MVVHATLARWMAATSAIALLGSCRTRPVEVAAMTVPPARPNTVVRGAVSFEMRDVGAQGYSQTVTVRPARFVIVEAWSSDGVRLAQGRTDAYGGFALESSQRPHHVTALSSIHVEGTCARESPPDAAAARVARPDCEPRMTLDVTRDQLGEHVYAIETPVPPDGSEPVAIRARLDTVAAEGGAFHILDTLERGLRAVHTWTGRELPPFFTIWQHEGPADWSYYRGERPASSGRYALELMGGEPGRSNITDADEHDEAIILHELGHFAFDMLSTDSSIGGSHPGHVLTDPGVAWEEGRATWFACAVLGHSLYRDAVGIEPAGRLRQNDRLEGMGPDALRGLGSQRSVEEVLWDLSDGTLDDGTTPLPDEDHDGIAIGPAAIMAAMIRLRSHADAYPSLVTFLRELVRGGGLREERAAQLLAQPTRHGIDFPPMASAERWPVALAARQEFHGKIDGLTDPAPSGGRAHPLNGYDAVRTFRVQVERPRAVRVTLSIEGHGNESDRTDLILELRSPRARVIERAGGASHTRELRRLLSAGTYIVVVRDAGTGNRADFTLRWQED